MFNNSRREIAHQNNRICIKIVDGPANPYKGVESITISSVSLENGKYYIDATGTELILKNNGKAFSGDSRGTWEYRGISPDRRSQPIQAKKMAECVTGLKDDMYRRWKEYPFQEWIFPTSINQDLDGWGRNQKVLCGMQQSVIGVRCGVRTLHH